MTPDGYRKARNQVSLHAYGKFFSIEQYLGRHFATLRSCQRRSLVRLAVNRAQELFWANTHCQVVLKELMRNQTRCIHHDSAGVGDAKPWMIVFSNQCV